MIKFLLFWLALTTIAFISSFGWYLIDLRQWRKSLCIGRAVSVEYADDWFNGVITDRVGDYWVVTDMNDKTWVVADGNLYPKEINNN